MAFAGDFAGSFVRILWEDKSLLEGLQNGDDRLREKVRAVLAYKAPQVEAYMKTNAPWTDQTGAARGGLRAVAFDEGGTTMGIVLYGQVPYQIWLELKYSGRDAIILPTIESQGPEVMRAIQNILGEI